MKRRDFLSNSSIALAGITSLLASSCKPKTNQATVSENDSTNSPEEFELNEISIPEIQLKVKEGKYSYEQITSIYLKRINDIDKKGPAINSVIEINPDAINIARAMDEERKSGKIRGPIHGIPVLIKDNIDTGDKMMTTAGSLAMEGNIAEKDAFLVTLLRKGGAVILGKTNLSEWANFRSTRSVSGWSSRGGQTKNPYVLDRTPCGSSSGTAVAVASNLCAAGIGTETDGSIACPSSTNSVVGIKPTVGLVSRSGIIPISHSMDTAGPITRTVTDAAILLNCIAGIDSEDEVTLESKGKESEDYISFLTKDGLKGKRIGIEKSFLNKHEGISDLLHKSIEIMKNKGAIIIEIELMKTLENLGDAEMTVLKYEFKTDLNKYLSHANAKMKSLKDIIAFNKINEAKVMRFFKQEIMDSTEVLGDLNSKEYLVAHKKLMETSKNSINKILKENNLEAICGPATGPPWCIDPVNGDSFSGYGAYSPAATAGYPSITIPMGFIIELPVGISFIGGAFSEGTLISIGYAFEQASLQRKAPKFLDTINS